MIDAASCLYHSKEHAQAEAFCNAFVQAVDRPKYLFGYNVYAEAVVKLIEIDGFIDDITDQNEFLGKPVFRIDKVPANALVLILASGKPLTAQAKLRQRGFECLDYFAFYKFSGLPLKPIVFLSDFDEDFVKNQHKFEAAYDRLGDEVSKEQFLKLVKFKLSHDLEYLRGFSHLEDEQYFEDFLELGESGEIFVDVGSFDGQTTEEFIRRCPAYQGVYLFEPDDSNMAVLRSKLASYRDITFFSTGLSDKKQRCRFSTDGSISRISEDGSVVIQVDLLDALIQAPVTFIKMDIEGGECSAIRGSERIIRECHPKLAISVYHHNNDFWRIPELVLSIRSDYDVFLRHYTESIYETVMFFVPQREETD